MDSAIISAVVAILVALLTNRNNVTNSSSTSVSNERSTWRASLKKITDKGGVLNDDDYATILSNINTYNITDKNARAYFLHDNHIKDLIEIPNHPAEKSEITKVFLRYLLKFDWERSKAEVRHVTVETAKKNYILELKELYMQRKFLTADAQRFFESRLLSQYNRSVAENEKIGVAGSELTPIATKKYVLYKKVESDKSSTANKSDVKKKANPEKSHSTVLYSVTIGVLLATIYALSLFSRALKINSLIIDWDIIMLIAILALYTYVLAQEPTLVNNVTLLNIGVISAEVSVVVLICKTDSPKIDWIIITALVALTIGLAITIYYSLNVYITKQHQKKGF